MEAEPTTPAQLKYLATLVEKVGKERFDAEFVKAVKGTGMSRVLPGGGPRPPRSG